MSEPRTTCAECGEELWGAEERFGLCLRCRRLEDEIDESIAASLDDEGNYP